MKMNESGASASFFKELGIFLKPYQGKYALSVVLSVCSVAAGIGAYAFAGKLAAWFFEKNFTWSMLAYLVVGVAVCKLMHAFLMNVSTWISHKAAYKTLRDLREAVSEKLLHVPLGYFENHGSGRLKAMLVDRIESMEKTLAHVIPELTANLLSPLVCIIWMFYLDWRLSLLALLWIILGFSVTVGMMKNYETKFAGQIQAMKGMNQAIVEFVNGIEVIKNYGQADACYRKYQEAIYHHAAYNVNWQKESQKYSSLGMAIAPFSIFPILLGGLYFYGQGSLEAGTLVLMMLLSCGIFMPLMNAMNYFDQLAAMGTNAEEVKAVLDIPELKRGSCSEVASFDVDFHDVGFSYKKKDGPVLHNVSFHLPQGSMLALVGPSGSGKSTIAKLLAGFWDVERGTIRIGGQLLSDFSQEALNQWIAFVDQETFLYDVSIMENIRIGRPEASDEEVRQAARLAGCDEFIRALPQGYNTRAGDAGGRLSGGEKQRISIVRAMMKDAPIMILDEATASTDPENEAAIQQALSVACKEKTLVVVAHRLSTVMHADQIALVEAGTIQAMGTHAELLENNLNYRTMWELSEGKKND